MFTNWDEQRAVLQQQNGIVKLSNSFQNNKKQTTAAAAAHPAEILSPSAASSVCSTQFISIYFFPIYTNSTYDFQSNPIHFYPHSCKPRQLNHIPIQSNPIHFVLPSQLQERCQGKFDIVLVCVKSYQTDRAAAVAKQLLKPDTGIAISLQNGLGTHLTTLSSVVCSFVPVVAPVCCVCVSSFLVGFVLCVCVCCFFLLLTHLFDASVCFLFACVTTKLVQMNEKTKIRLDRIGCLWEWHTQDPTFLLLALSSTLVCFIVLYWIGLRCFLPPLPPLY